MTRFNALLAAGGLLVALTACSGGGGAPGGSSTPTGPSNPVTPTVTAVTVFGAPADSIVFVGSTRQLTAAGQLSNGQTSTDTPAWTSSNTAFATVSGAGLVSGVAVGSVQVRATIGGVTGQATLLIRAPVGTPATPAIRLAVGAAATATVANAQDLSIPLSLDLSNPPAGANVAAVSYTITWNPTNFDFKSGTAASNGWSTTANTTTATSGSIAVSAFNVTGTTASLALYTLVLTAKSTGTTVVSAANVVGGSANGAAVTVTPRNLTVSINP